MKQRRGKRGERHFVETQRTCPRVRLQPVDQVAAANDESGLWTTEQFIAGKTDQRGPCLNAALDPWFRRQSKRRGIDQAPRSNVVDDRHVVLPADCDHLFNRNFVGESNYPKVATVDPQQHSGLIADRRGVVRRVGPIGRSDFNQPATALAKDVWYAKSPADFDCLPAGHNDIPPGAEGGQHHQHGGGIVVNRNTSFSAGNPAKQGFEVGVPGPAGSAVQIELEV